MDLSTLYQDDTNGSLEHNIDVEIYCIVEEIKRDNEIWFWWIPQRTVYVSIAESLLPYRFKPLPHQS